MRIGFSEKAKSAINAANECAAELGHSYIGTEHILFGLASVSDSFTASLLSEQGATPEAIKQAIASMVGSENSAGESARDYTPRTKRMIETSARLAAQCGQNVIAPEHLFYALLSERDSYGVQILRNLGASPEMLEGKTDDYMRETYFGTPTSEPGQSSEGYGKKGAKIDGAETLSTYGRDLCAMAKEGKIDPIIGRDEETERVIQILSRRTKNNPCLIGEPGVGKTAVVEGLAQRIVEERVPESLAGKKIVTLDISAMVAGAKYRGEFEERLKKVMAEVAENKQIILFIDEIHTVIGAGGAEGAVDAANIIKPALARGEMQLIGATTIEEYRKYIEKDVAFERRFQPVMVGEPTPEDAIQILRGLKDKYEAHHKVTISDEAVEAAVRLSVRYIGDRFLPDKAIDLIDEAASKKRLSQMQSSPEMAEVQEKIKSVSAAKEEAIRSEKYEEAARLRDEESALEKSLKDLREQKEKETHSLIVSEEDIADVVTAWTHIPVRKLADEEGERLLHLEELLKARIIGQDEAVTAVAKAIRRGRVGLKNPKRPTGSFIFLGPTGVGKTELCKALADVMFGDENAIIRIDMSEYMEKYSVSKLIGSPPGYVGYEEGGQLTEKVRRRPYSVVLFDEIEKAHPDVFNLLLQILEDGILTDSQGRRVDFKNTVIIMTSNCGAGQLNETKHFGFTSVKESLEHDVQKEDMLRSLKDTFRPEFLNRIDEIIVFNKLNEEAICRITSLMLKEVGERVAQNEIELTFDDDVVSFLAKEGYDPVYGARPLRRAVVRLIEDSLSEEMLAGHIEKGDKVVAKLVDQQIHYEKI